MLLWDRDWHFYHSWLYIKSQEQYTLEQYYYIALYRQQIPAVWHYVTLQNTELTIYQETIQLAQINIKFFQVCTYNTDKYWSHLIDFMLDQQIINLGPVAPTA